MGLGNLKRKRENNSGKNATPTPRRRAVIMNAIACNFEEFLLWKGEMLMGLTPVIQLQLQGILATRATRDICASHIHTIVHHLSFPSFIVLLLRTTTSSFRFRVRSLMSDLSSHRLHYRKLLHLIPAGWLGS